MLIRSNIPGFAWKAKLLAGLVPSAAAALALSATPVAAQAAPTSQEAVVRKLEAEVRALQREVFSRGDNKAPASGALQSSPDGALPTDGTASSRNPTEDILARLHALELRIARMDARADETANRLVVMESRTGTPTALAAAPATSPAPASASATPRASAPPATLAAAPAPSSGAGGSYVRARRMIAARPTQQPLTYSAGLTKAVTGEMGDVEYNYGFRLWQAKLYPEAQQQLRLFVQKYPNHPKISYGRNLLGRAYLDDGKPREAAPWFLANYQADKKAPRAADSLLYLAEARRQQGDNLRACKALEDFAATYPGEPPQRLKQLADWTRSSITCE